MDHTGSHDAPIANGSITTLTQVNNGGGTAVVANNGVANLDLTLALGMNNNNGSDAIIVIEDSDDEGDGDSDGFGPDHLF